MIKKAFIRVIELLTGLIDRGKCIQTTLRNLEYVSVFITVFWKMLRKISRRKKVLVIICLGGMLVLWSLDQFEQFEKRMDLVVPVLPSNTQQYGGLEADRSIDEKVWKGDDNHDIANFANQQHGEKTNSLSEESVAEIKKDSPRANNKILNKNIEVLVNGNTKIQGRLENNEVYIPFSFIKRYFEIEGKIVSKSFWKAISCSAH